MTKTIRLFVLLFLGLTSKIASAQAPANDNCSTAEYLLLSESGNTCISASNVNATSDGVFNGCDGAAVLPLPPGGNEIWYTYVAGGIVNSINITPFGSTPAQQVSVTVTNGNCAVGGVTICSNAVNPGDPVSVVFTETPGTQVWFYVTSLIADGDFLVCVNSVTGPVNPGTNCGNAARICNKLDFTSPGLGTSGFAPTPGCFNSPPVRPMWYKFTTGTAGPLEFAGFPTGFGGFRWAMYDITAGCPGIEVACNNFYDPFQPFGLSSSVVNCTSSPYCAPVNVTAGSTYALMIDDTTQSNSGFDFNWSTTVKLLPTAQFSVDSIIGCGTLTLDFTDESVYDNSTAYFLDYGDGSATYAGTGSSFTLPSHIYNPGTYLVQLTLNQPGGCNNSFSRQVIVYPKPVSTFTTSDDSLCLNNGSQTGALFTVNSISTTAAYNWIFSSTSATVFNSNGIDSSYWKTPGIYPVELTVSENGCVSDTSRDTIHVINSPTANFSLADSACTNADITVQYTGNGSAAAAYNWNYGGASTSNVTNQSFDASWNTIGTKILSLTVAENGCSSPLYEDSVVISLTPSVAIFDFTRVCQEDTLLFTPLANSTAILNFTWNFGTSTFISGNAADGSSGILTWNTPGITYWTAYGVTAEGCVSNKDSISFTVYPKPDASFTLSKDQLCGNDTSQLIFTGSASASAVYNFSNGGSLVNGILPDTLLLSFPGGPTTYPIYISITDNLCIADTVRDTIFVYPIPLADAGLDTSMCAGTAISIGSPLIAGQTYSWLPLSFLSNPAVSNPQVNIPVSGIADTTIRYIVTATSGVCNVNDTVFVTSHPHQYALFNHPADQCFDENNFSFITSSQIINNAMFAWDFSANANPDSGFSSQVSNIHFNTAGWEYITLNAQSSGCPLESHRDSVFIKTSPVVKTDANIFDGCPPFTVSFSNLSAAYPNSTMQWDFADGNFSDQNNPDNTYIYPGTYFPTLTITTQDNCSATDTLNTPIVVSALPVGNFSAIPPVVYDAYPIINFNNNNEQGVKCSYDFGDGLTDTICNVYHTYGDTGTFIVTLITENINGCVDTSTQTVVVKSLYTLFIAGAFTPNDDGVNDVLGFSSNAVEKFEIKIYNRFGQVVFATDSPRTSWNGNFLDTNTKCPVGVYVYSGKSVDTNNKKHDFSGSITLMR